MVRGGCWTLLGLGAALALAPSAQATIGTSYGGATFDARSRLSATSVALQHRADGSVIGHVGTSIDCGRRGSWVNLAFRVRSGPTGDAFTAGDSLRLRGRSRVIVTVTGTMAPTSASGTVSYRFTRKLKDCRQIPTRRFIARTASNPSGAPSIPPGTSVRLGFTSQSRAGLQLPMALQVRPRGRRVNALWQATLRCGRGRIHITNFSRLARIRPDGRFKRNERFTIRYTTGGREHFRIRFRGRFLADGVRGTLRVRMQFTKPGAQYVPCDSGTRRWTAAG